MTCDTVRQEMLEADLADLRGVANTPLAAHLAGCNECREVARAILQAEEAMASALSAIATEGRGNGRRIPSRTVGYWAAMVPLAAAASLVVALLPIGSRPHPVTESASQPDEVVPFIESTGNQNLAVFNTGDPDIVVIWFFGGTN